MIEPSFVFQLVFQFPCHSIQDYSRMIQLEDKMEQLSEEGSWGIVDGHDAGPNEMNIFILTNHPQEAFKALLPVTKQSFVAFQSAFRSLDGDEYTVLYPEGQSVFKLA
jgi:hypothetical protein